MFLPFFVILPSYLNNLNLFILEKTDSILHSMYLRLDTTTKYLTKNAESQLLVKIIFQHSNSTFEEVCKYYKDSIKVVSEDRLKELLSDLTESGEVLLKKGRYSIPRRKIEKIETALSESHNRFQRIINTFEPYFSDTEVVEKWLIDAMMCFFSTFSDDWVSD